jgi:hypothetical protein
MKDNAQEGGPATESAKNKRQDRLKLALRENLRRRKSQARERGDFALASSASDEVARKSGEDDPG